MQIQKQNMNDLITFYPAYHICGKSSTSLLIDTKYIICYDIYLPTKRAETAVLRRFYTNFYIVVVFVVVVSTDVYISLTKYFKLDKNDARKYLISFT